MGLGAKWNLCRKLDGLVSDLPLIRGFHSAGKHNPRTKEHFSLFTVNDLWLSIFIFNVGHCLKQIYKGNNWANILQNGLVKVRVAGTTIGSLIWVWSSIILLFIAQLESRLKRHV